ncbi:MAG TPA: hypothetical protein EYN06_00090 [Myxococcales bacterium]|nr:hypothetical protein [Myxococcales bacterium]HIN84847.1 hypothetical protein [Myxococcales bacterium]
MKHFLLIALLCGCSAYSTTQVKKAPSPLSQNTGIFLPLNTVLPAAPVGFGKAIDVAVRNKDTIFEQINGASVSYLEHGMRDALFATYPKPGDQAQDINLELYRFTEAHGAKLQFTSINGNEARPWEGTMAVRHDFGLELVAGRHLLRIIYNGGPVAEMRATVSAIAKKVLAHLSP